MSDLFDNKVDDEISVAIIDPLGPHGGMHYYTHNQANALVERGARVFVYMAESNLANKKYEHIKLFSGVYGKQPKILSAIKLILSTIRSILYLKINKMDWAIYHVFKGDIFELIFFLLCRCFHIKTVCIVHDVERLDVEISRDLLSHILRLSNVIVAHNLWSKDIIERRFPKLSTSISICHHGNYIEDYPGEYDRDVARNNLGLPLKKKIILFFGNPRLAKGLSILLESMNDQNLEDVLLVIAGRMKEPLRSEIEEQIDRLNLRDRIIMFPDRVSDEDLPRFFSAANLIVLPYIRVYESGVALMGMSLKRAVLASDLVPFRDLIREGVTGYLFRSSDIVNLRESLRRILENTDQFLDEIGMSGHVFVKENRGWNNSAENLLHALRH